MTTDADLMQEIRLYENSSERERVDNMSELYAVLNSLECLEKVFSRDCIPPKEYTAECSKLLVQYKVALRLVENANIEEFVRKYHIQCPAALERIREDRPITVRDDKGILHKTEVSDALRRKIIASFIPNLPVNIPGNTLKCIADIVELFITFLDQLKLNFRAVDELMPNLTELLVSINAMSQLSDDFEAKVRVKSWHDKLKDMGASDEISEEMARQMIFEMEGAYNAFQRYLRNS